MSGPISNSKVLSFVVFILPPSKNWVPISISERWHSSLVLPSEKRPAPACHVHRRGRLCEIDLWERGDHVHPWLYYMLERVFIESLRNRPHLCRCMPRSVTWAPEFRLTRFVFSSCLELETPPPVEGWRRLENDTVEHATHCARWGTSFVFASAFVCGNHDGGRPGSFCARWRTRTMRKWDDIVRHP
ncbi:unnamed protein product [Sphacelaria rigidula]